MTAEKLPIVYVRGFAGSSSEIDDAVDDPFYGFNKGAVHVRIGGGDVPQFYQFEGPLLRLIQDEAYQLLVHGNQFGFLADQEDGSLPRASVWVHRFYDPSASTLGSEPTKFVLEDAAADLFTLVKLVLAKTGAERVFLVAHSMGGLICRSLIQRVIPQAEGRLDAATRYIDRLFTYGTPHGGIWFGHGFGLLEKVRDLFDIDDAAIFGPDRMHQYLTLEGGDCPESWSAAVVPDGVFPRERIFCLVGTDSTDYGVALGLSAKLVGVRSDGLVQIDHAHVPGANRAYVHRSHSGRYGLVNSEEGYQNLRRFLFGDLRVQVDLVDVDLAGAGGDRTVWQLDVQLAIRQLPSLIHEQTAAHHCPVQLDHTSTGDAPVPVLTTFLSARLPRPSDTDTLRYGLHLRLMSFTEDTAKLAVDPTDHLEQMADFDDTLVVDVQPCAENDLPQAWATWNSAIPGAIRDWTPGGDPLPDLDGTGGSWVTKVEFPATARAVLGSQAAVRLTLTPWD